MSQIVAPPNVYYKHAIAPPGWDDAWKAAKASVGSSQVNVVSVGDSIAQGNVSSSYRTKAWLGLVANKLWASYGKAGEFIGVTESTAAGLGGASGFAAGEAMWAVTAGSWSAYAAGMCGYSAQSASSGAALTFTAISGLTFTAFDLIVQQEPTNMNTFTVSVDGGAVTATGGVGLQTCLTAGAWNRHVAIPFDGLTNAAHTIAIAAAAVAKNLILAGIVVYPAGRAASGVVFNRVNLGGKTTQIGIPLWPSHLSSADAQTPYQPAMATVQDFNPKLTILSLGVNDCGNYFGTAMTAYALGQLAQAAQNAGSSILFVIPYIGIPGLTNYTSWPLYVKAIKEVAGDFNAAVCNVHSYWAANPNGAGYIYTDGIHPIDAGHASIAAFVGSVL